jgi:hypothetical protein
MGRVKSAKAASRVVAAEQPGDVAGVKGLPGWAGEIGKAHVSACAGWAGEIPQCAIKYDLVIGDL